MLLIPTSFHETISREYSAALKKAEHIRKDKLPAIEIWRENPESFGWYMLACDVKDRHTYFNTWVEHKFLTDFSGLFNQKAFDSLFYKFAKICAPKDKCGEFEVAEVVVTHGDIAPQVLYQVLGKEALKKLPGFFGNFYIQNDDISKELLEYQKLMSKTKWSELIHRGIDFYNAPCNGNEDSVVIEEILQALPNALQYAKKKGCGLLGLVVTAG